MSLVSLQFCNRIYYSDLSCFRCKLSTGMISKNNVDPLHVEVVPTIYVATFSVYWIRQYILAPYLLSLTDITLLDLVCLRYDKRTEHEFRVTNDATLKTYYRCYWVLWLDHWACLPILGINYISKKGYQTSNVLTWSVLAVSQKLGNFSCRDAPRISNWNSKSDINFLQSQKLFMNWVVFPLHESIKSQNNIIFNLTSSQL